MLRHPVDSGAPFRPSKKHLAEISNWFRNAALVLNELSNDEEGASEVRLWPHHFDMATLIAIDADQSVESARSINVGLSPGDTEADEPYWYVSPWPYPEEKSLPEVTVGSWTTIDWTGLILSASDVVSGEGAEDQNARVSAFLAEGVSTCRELLA
jgi:hypothetical protein